MVRIISDTSTLYSTIQAQEAGFAVAPLSVHIGGSSYREFDEISAEEFVAKIHEGNMPNSSQPAIGEVLALYERFSGEEILNISMAHGLSGTYASAVAAAELCEGNEKITVLNSRTLCGLHRYLVENAVKMAAINASLEEIVQRTEALMQTAKSYLIPADFAYLRRGGRLSPLVSYVGQATQFAPILAQTETGEKLTIASVRRSFLHAVKYVAKALQERCQGEGWRIYISHADTRQMAEKAYSLLTEVLPEAYYEILPLSPAFITQGGPGCVAIQVIQS